MKPFQYLRPGSVQEAIKMAADNPQSQFIAGGTNLIDLMKRGITTPGTLIDINHLPLKKVEYRTGRLRIGALASNSDVAQNKLVSTRQPLLAQALLAGASGQLRNMATVGGNLLQRTRCSYFYDLALPCNKRQPDSGCGAIGGIDRTHAVFFETHETPRCIAVHPGDMSVALTALDTLVVVMGSNGERRIPINEFHRMAGSTPDRDTDLQPGELVTAIEIPDNFLAQHSHYLKVRDRASYAFALVSVAVGLRIENGLIADVRAALGGVAHKPWRMSDAEAMLNGQPVSEALFRSVAEHELSSAKGGGHNEYKIKLAGNAIVSAFKSAAGIS